MLFLFWIRRYQHIHKSMTWYLRHFLLLKLMNCFMKILFTRMHSKRKLHLIRKLNLSRMNNSSIWCWKVFMIIIMASTWKINLKGKQQKRLLWTTGWCLLMRMSLYLGGKWLKNFLLGLTTLLPGTGKDLRLILKTMQQGLEDSHHQKKVSVWQ